MLILSSLVLLHNSLNYVKNPAPGYRGVRTMLIIISSAKTQAVTDFTLLPAQQPPLLNLAQVLVKHCLQLDREKIASLMKLSDALAETTCQRFKDFSIPHEPGSAGPALTTFKGDVFAQISSSGYQKDDFIFAQKHLRILSGLYGILGPLDLMQPYRLEMGTKLTVGRYANLYEFWSGPVTEQINLALKRSGSSTLINCASKEYARAVLPKKLDGAILDVVFKQRQDAVTRTVAIHAKRARGMFVDWFIANRIRQKAQLSRFDRGGYHYAPELSSERELVFITDLT